jgi:3'(2'), 5'-bisphosphate nucleotidase
MWPGSKGFAAMKKGQEIMTPELIIAVEVCLKVGRAMLERGCCYAHAQDEECYPEPSIEDAGIELYFLIERALSVTGLPVVGGYGESVRFDVRSDWKQYWLVDPIEGELESHEGPGTCTVSVALIEGHEPVLGVIYAPASDTLYCASRETGAYRVQFASSMFAETSRLDQVDRTSPVPTSRPRRMLVDRLHLDQAMLDYIEELGSEYPGIELVQREGGLDLCLVAEGSADIYPRLESTCEWETAAGHAILKATGRNIVEFPSGRELIYNTPEMINPYFVAS